MKGLFLPLGLIIAFIIAWLTPSVGSELKQLGVIPWMVVTIFLINGYQTNLSEIPRDRSFLFTLIIAAVISLLIAPLIGLGVTQLLAIPAGLTLGLLVTAAVPPTLSTCIVMTQLANGYALWALVMTVTINIAGVFSIPFVLDLMLKGSGELSISPLPLLQKLMLLVLLPFIVGNLLKRIATVNPKNPILQYLPSLCVILTVWMALSDSSDVFRILEPADLLKVALAVLLIHFLLMLFSDLSARGLKLQAGARIALIFTASQKTLPVAVSVLAALNLPYGEAILACVTFHFIMLFCDSMLTPKLRIKEQTTS